MAKKITIRKLKNIKELVFELPSPGVHLLAGKNGAGKTSLLACLRRIGHRNAFAYHFASSQRSQLLDNFGDAEIVYTLENDEVTYAYAGERWVPRPRSKNRLLDKFGYRNVLYVGATADRITPRPEDFRPQRLGQAPQIIRDTANRIFGTNKFDGLKTINLAPGVGNSAYVLQATPPPGATYFSERNFSLGEICILKLVRQLTECANNSLVLIDELELALHPRAQIELLGYLHEISKQKQLTVIFSTHSVSLLKRVDRKTILFLESLDGIVTCTAGCYPTYALGSIAYDEERAPDIVMYVEDEMALYVTQALVRLCISRRFQNQAALFPTVHVVPIGTFISVVRYLNRSDALLPATTKAFALLDSDVITENVHSWRQSQNHAALAEFEALNGRIHYLPWTPEVGLVAYLQDPAARAERSLRDHFGNHLLVVPPNLLANVSIAGDAKSRDECKAAIREIATRVAQALPNTTVDQVRKSLSEIFAKWYFDNHAATAMQRFGPMLGN